MYDLCPDNMITTASFSHCFDGGTEEEAKRIVYVAKSIFDELEASTDDPPYWSVEMHTANGIYYVEIKSANCYCEGHDREEELVEFYTDHCRHFKDILQRIKDESGLEFKSGRQ